MAMCFFDKILLMDSFWDHEEVMGVIWIVFKFRVVIQIMHPITLDCLYPLRTETFVLPSAALVG